MAYILIFNTLIYCHRPKMLSFYQLPEQTIPTISEAYCL